MTSKDNTCLAALARFLRYRQRLKCDDAVSAVTWYSPRLTSPTNKAYVAKTELLEVYHDYHDYHDTHSAVSCLESISYRIVTSEWSHSIIMDHYPEVNVEVQEHPSSASRHDSASSVAKAADFHSPPSLVPSRQPSRNMSSTTAPSNTSTQQRTSSDAPTSAAATQHAEQQTEQQERKDSIHTDEQTAERLKSEFARYTDAPPPYSEEQYADKTEEQQLSMRTHDYAKELSRMMGHQLVRGLRTDDAEDK